jgi:hypothetical protein
VSITARSADELHAFAAGYTPPAGFTRWELEWGEFAGEIVQRSSLPAELRSCWGDQWI